MLLFCLIITIFTGLVSAGLVFTTGAGLALVLTTYSLSGACALVVSMTAARIVYPDWKAFS